MSLHSVIVEDAGEDLRGEVPTSVTVDALLMSDEEVGVSV